MRRIDLNNISGDCSFSYGTSFKETPVGIIPCSVEEICFEGNTYQSTEVSGQYFNVKSGEFVELYLGEEPTVNKEELKRSLHQIGRKLVLIVGLIIFASFVFGKSVAIGTWWSYVLAFWTVISFFILMIFFIGETTRCLQTITKLEILETEEILRNKNINEQPGDRSGETKTST